MGDHKKDSKKITERDLGLGKIDERGLSAW